jgi:hypothetical protein
MACVCNIPLLLLMLCCLAGAFRWTCGEASTDGNVSTYAAPLTQDAEERMWHQAHAGSGEGLTNAALVTAALAQQEAIRQRLYVTCVGAFQGAGPGMDIMQ